jgi:hypothetical protein
MGLTTHSIEVNSPLRAVYNQWTQFEEFPRFMEGVVEVRQDGPNKLFWNANIGGKEKIWTAEITEQIPDKRIVWNSIDGTPNSGEVTFEPLGPDRTRITLTLAYEPEGILEKTADALGIPSSQVEEDLNRFRNFIEANGVETNAWRGQIGQRANPETPAQSFGAVSFGDRNEGTIGGEVRETAGESTVFSENAEAYGSDTTPAEVRLHLEGATPPIECPDAPTETTTAPEAQQFYRESIRLLAPTHEQIAHRAYELYQARGKTPGHEEEDWMEAEKLLSETSLTVDS